MPRNNGGSPFEGAWLYKEKKTFLYRERKEEQRIEFEEKLKVIPLEKRIYIDESGFDSRLEIEQGYSLKGVRCYGERSGSRKDRVSVIGALRGTELFSTMTFKGTCNRHVFEGWADACFFSELHEGDVVILDNASIHKSSYFVGQVEAKGAYVLWLPSYSPDKNPIEKTWATLKKSFRYIKHTIDDIHDAVDHTIAKFMNATARKKAN
jgi:transposase